MLKRLLIKKSMLGLRDASKIDAMTSLGKERNDE